MAEQDELVFGAPAGTVSAAAAAAAAEYEGDAEKQMEAIAAALKAKVEAKTKEYMKAAYQAQSTGVAELAAEPFAGGYQWWNMYVFGPWQWLAPGGPFAPHKIIRVDPNFAEPAFLVAVIWTNPIPTIIGPSASVLMNGWNYTAWFQSGNLTTWGNGPDFGPFNGNFGLGPVADVIVVNLTGPGGFTAPPQGTPNLYEINMTADVTGPGVVPFAGYSTWVLDPDTEPPFLGVPGQGPRWQHDIPVRVLAYRA